MVLTSKIHAQAEIRIIYEGHHSFKCRRHRPKLYADLVADVVAAAS